MLNQTWLVSFPFVSLSFPFLSIYAPFISFSFHVCSFHFLFFPFISLSFPFVSLSCPFISFYFPFISFLSFNLLSFPFISNSNQDFLGFFWILHLIKGGVYCLEADISSANSSLPSRLSHRAPRRCPFDVTGPHEELWWDLAKAFILPVPSTVSELEPHKQRICTLDLLDLFGRRVGGVKATCA